MKRDASTPESLDAKQSALVADLERRIEELENLDESAFGNFTTWDWLLCIFGALVIPYLALLWFAQ
jgi:hypothetical protein